MHRSCSDCNNDKYKTYKCIEKKKSGEECGSIIKVGMWNPCSNLKRHLERFHAKKSKKVKQADEQDLKFKQKKLELNNQPLIASHFQPQSVTVAMNKDKFIWGIIQLIMSGVALRFFESPGFQTLNGEITRKLGVSISRESIRRYVVDAANKMRESLINDLKDKLLFIKMDSATRQFRSFLGINVQYYDKNKDKSEVKMLACANIAKRHTSRQMCNLFTATMQQFGIAKKNILCLVVDNPSNMTKTIEHLNEDDPEVESDTPQDEAADESEDYDGIEDNWEMRVNIHHMRCAVHTLQLAIKDGLKLPNCDKLLTKTRHISPNICSCWKNEEKNGQYLI